MVQMGKLRLRDRRVHPMPPSLVLRLSAELTTRLNCFARMEV